jgi:hypothetical protein
MVAIVQKMVLGGKDRPSVWVKAKAGLAKGVRQNLLSRVLEVSYITSTASTSTGEVVSATS